VQAVQKNYNAVQTAEGEMQGTVLAETEAFIAKQREALLNERQEMVNRQRALQAPTCSSPSAADR